MKKKVLSDALREFLLEKQLAGLSVETVKDYRNLVQPFIKFCGDIGVYELTDANIDAYISDVLSRPLARSTQITYIRNLKTFLKWSAGKYRVRYDYTRIHVPKSPKKNVRIYDESEIVKIFDTVHAESDWMTLRNKSLLALMLDSGIRQKEVCTLKRDLVSFERRYMVVQGKGDKERVVPLGLFSMELLKRYLEACPYQSKYIFVNRFGDMLTRNAVKILVGRLQKELPFDLSSHKLRHNFATNYCVDHYQEHGTMDAYKLMCLMGHEDMETTKRYLHHATEIIAAQEHLSHLDRIRSKKE